MISTSEESTFEWLGSPAGGLAIWGLTTRGLLLVASLSLASLAVQLRGLSGAHGISPSVSFLRGVARDFGLLRGLIRWPSLLWAQLLVPASLADALLVGVPAAAAAAALAGAVVGGGAGWAGTLAAWAALLSVDVGAHALVYPWDSLLLEALFLALWLPPLERGSVAATALPTPLLAGAFRLLTARVLLGFGKLKFVGSTKADDNYIKHFMITQPFLTRAGAMVHAALPAWAWRAALAGMFAVEIPFQAAALLAPVASAGAGVGVGNVIRVACVGAVVGLMAGIQLTGNFGTFNVLTAVLVLPYLHHTASLLDTCVGAHVLDSPAHAAFAALAVVYLVPATAFAFILNSWANLGWLWWAGLHLLRPALLFDSVFGALRALAPLRLVAAYGVFPPSSFPAQRWVVRYEVRVAAGPREAAAPRAVGAWSALPCPYLDRALCRAAPHHPRVAHALFYEGMGLGAYSPGAVLGHHSPYKAGWVNSEWLRLQLRVASAHLPGGLRRGADARALLAPSASADAAARALDDFVRDARPLLLDAPFWPPRDAPELPRAAGRAPALPRCSSASVLAAEWEYVGPLVEARATLSHQLPAGEYRRAGAAAECAPGAAARAREPGADGDWIETLAGEHLPAVTALHLLRRRRARDGAGAAAPLRRRGGDGAAAAPAGKADDADAGAEAEYALAQDEAFLALESGGQFGRSAADFPPDCVYWRRAALRPAPRARDDAGVALAWRFLGMLRYAAVLEAARRAGLPAKAQRVNAKADAEPLRGGLVAVDRIVDATRLLVDTPAATLRAAAEAGARFCGVTLGVAPDEAARPPDIDAPLDAALANVLFSFAQLPGVVAAVRGAFSPLQLCEVERGVAALTLPLLETLEAACWRPPPTPAALAGELAAAGVAPDGAFAAWYARLGDAIAGTPPRPSGRPPTLPGTLGAGADDAASPAAPAIAPPHVAPDGRSYAVLAFADNDDAGEAGCLRNAWRLGCYAHWLLLVGGRRAYEHATAAPPAGAASPAAALARLVPDPPARGPARVASEAGAFTHGVLHYDIYAAAARRARAPGLVARPPAALPPAALPPLPGFLELGDRLAAHCERLRAWGPAAGELVEGVAAPAWGLTASGDWMLIAPPADDKRHALAASR